MKANELRVGNKILFSEDQTEFEVIEISSTGLSVSNLKELTWIEIDQFEGISLTEERFLRFGAKSFKTHLEIKYSNQGELIIFDWNTPVAKSCELKKGEYYTIINGLMVILKYAHQLQNLYFVLSGNELETNKD